ncbi:Vacuolar protein sorting 4B (Vps4B) [Monocercomonoides exilis]|uniref:Vacuolar protein sorting 4B (Vps4B) n=1 Tax=Monocercomonoides exilis TaxID=2049356 RepID=UPI00355AAFBC|nr:Vacuolar protein sorting 4B (Vps4B) [Monocercomonoides exilis]|eukprot:MONOS_1448.1-p1 / transcript=MONOS_1448.1 / gene=MONOS_1448 / organism=Monocercomonoides_exilis_PA203 / gene_product= Vacuolar protein sorting 4B (Vps4B) / transcript_product= Vacuolar protein sorting 4B (Vps4B) / location=Mono_scaffold00025:218250-219876(-) / protein_length=437 / sequence_SO=supercontig / SO=protein_coding / is_pseudo=false
MKPVALFILVVGTFGNGKSILASSFCSKSRAKSIRVPLLTIGHLNKHVFCGCIQSVLDRCCSPYPYIVNFEGLDDISGHREGRFETHKESLANELIKCLGHFKASTFRPSSEITRTSKNSLSFSASSPIDFVVIVSTSLPWELSTDERDLFDYIVDAPYWSLEERMGYFRSEIERHNIKCMDSFVDYEQIALRTEGYINSDLSIIVREALMIKLREIINSDSCIQMKVVKADGCGYDVMTVAKKHIGIVLKQNKYRREKAKKMENERISKECSDEGKCSKEFEQEKSEGEITQPSPSSTSSVHTIHPQIIPMAPSSPILSSAQSTTSSSDLPSSSSSSSFSSSSSSSSSPPPPSSSSQLLTVCEDPDSDFVSEVMPFDMSQLDSSTFFIPTATTDDLLSAILYVGNRDRYSHQRMDEFLSTSPNWIANIRSVEELD